MSLCRYCGKLIYWVRDQEDKPVAVEPEPEAIEETPDGEVFLIDDGCKVRGRILEKDNRPRFPLIGYIPHSRGCPVIKRKKEENQNGKL